MTVTISAKRQGFRRCGIAHSKAPVQYPDNRWSKQQIEILQAEPMLDVAIGDAGSTAAGTGADAAREQMRRDLNKHTVAELTAMIEAAGAAIEPGAKKADLVELLLGQAEEKGK